MINCDNCPDSSCCKDVTVEIDDPEDFEDWDEIRWMVAHKNVSVYRDDEEDWLVEFKTPCDKLDESGKCTVYDKRPKTCKEHPEANCVHNGEDDDDEIRFNTMEEVEKYVREKVLPGLEKEAKDNLEKLQNLKWGKDQE